GLLTNMYPGLLDTIYARGDLMELINWNVVVDSSLVKAQKPDKKIFEIAESKVDCPPGEILFVENQQRHLDGAKQLGWQTFLYDSSRPAESSQTLANFLQL
ncbi:MAG: HAD-superfamily hydrolase, subfamily IA, variant 3, partial [Microgenomates group bacterium GW2011_GWC2_46_7]